MIITHHDWRKLKEDFEKEGYAHWQEEYIASINGEPVMTPEEIAELVKPNKWDTPLSQSNPEIIQMLINLNERLEKLEEEVKNARENSKSK